MFLAAEDWSTVHKDFGVFYSSAAQLAQNPLVTSSSKHILIIDICHRFLKELVVNGIIIILHTRSEFQHDFL